MAAKKKTTTRVSSAFKPKDRPAPVEAQKAAAEITGKKEETRGRKKATHGLSRTSIMMDKEKMHWFKQKGLDTGKYVYELLDEAFSDYIKKHK